MVKSSDFFVWLLCGCWLVVLRLNVPVTASWVIPVLSGSKVSCSRTQHGGGRFRTPDLSLRSPTLYHWATALPPSVRNCVILIAAILWSHPSHRPFFFYVRRCNIVFAHNKRNVVVWLAQYNVYRYIGCITDQSYWSGPFSLVVMTPD